MLIGSGGISWTNVRVPRILSRAAMATYAIGNLASVASLLHGGSHEFFRLFAFALVPVMWFASYILSLSHSWTPGSVEVREASLVVRRGKKVTAIARRDIVSALVVDRQVGGGFVTTVEIELAKGDRVTVRVPEMAPAYALVEALGFGPGGARRTVSLATPSRRLIHPPLGFLAHMVAMCIFAPLLVIQTELSVPLYGLQPLAALLIYLGIRRLVRDPKVTIGDDGVLVARGLRDHFVPRRDITSVAVGQSIVITRKNGPNVVIGALLVDDARRLAVARAIDTSAPELGGDRRMSDFDRAGRPVAEWRENLRVAMENGNYRSAATSVDDASAIVRSPSATAEQRVGAALALRITGEPASRIRIAADAVVDAPVREALEAIAEDDDLRLEKAMKRIS